MRHAWVVCLGLAACAGAPPARSTPFSESCDALARKVGRDSVDSEGTKRAMMEAHRDETFRWRLRLLAFSELADNLEGPRLFALEAECADWPRLSQAGTPRYALTVYVDEAQAPALRTLRRGQVLEVVGRLGRYEGSGAFFARANELSVAPVAPAAPPSTEQAGSP